MSQPGQKACDPLGLVDRLRAFPAGSSNRRKRKKSFGRLSQHDFPSSKAADLLLPQSRFAKALTPLPRRWSVKRRLARGFGRLVARYASTVAGAGVSWQSGSHKPVRGPIAMPDFKSRRLMMVDTQVRPSDVTKFPIIDAMLRVPREAYVPNGKSEAAYVGENLPLGPNRVMLEARTLAKMLDALALRAEDVVLDIGCGYGYSSAVIAEMVEAVIAIEEDPDMAQEAQRTLAAQGVDNVAVIEGRLADGAKKHGPYDVMILQGAVEQISDAILAQLKDGGRIAALFAEGALGVVRIGFKLNGTVTWRFDFNAGAPVLPGFEKSSDFVF
jgi:protein-L-isoaspartate(D-aspartate) O-methyltransferase